MTDSDRLNLTVSRFRPVEDPKAPTPAVGERYLSRDTGNVFRVVEIREHAIMVEREGAGRFDEAQPYAWTAECFRSMTCLGPEESAEQRADLLRAMEAVPVVARKLTKAQRDRLREAFGDKVRCHADGTATFKQGYFYRHGLTPEKVAQRVADAFPGSEIISADDVWRAWPKDSNFVVRFRPAF